MIKAACIPQATVLIRVPFWLLLNVPSYRDIILNVNVCRNTYNCSNGCGANTRKRCVACTNKITSKPANSTYTYSSCYDGTTKQIQTGWKCNSGYHQKGSTCEKDCKANSCSGYSLSSCPANGNCSSCTVTNSDCSTGSKKYKITSCKSGYKAVYVDTNNTIIRNCVKKLDGSIGNLTPVTGGTTCAGDSKWMTCGGNRCCCPKDRGCDTNSKLKWCYCQKSDALAE